MQSFKLLLISFLSYSPDSKTNRAEPLPTQRAVAGAGASFVVFALFICLFVVFPASSFLSHSQQLY